ncbi:MAG: hypothetical protein ACLFSQ_07025 [Candidatus Zixiibacteriota bacterium]
MLEQFFVEFIAEIFGLSVIGIISLGGWLLRRRKKKKRMDFIRQIDELNNITEFDTDEAIVEIENMIDRLRNRVVNYYIKGQISREGLDLLNERINNQVNQLRYRYLSWLLADSPKLKFTIGILSLDNRLDKNDIKTILNEIRKDNYLSEKEKVDHIYHIKNTFGERNKIIDTRELFYSDPFIEDRHQWNNIKPFIIVAGIVLGLSLLAMLIVFGVEKSTFQPSALDFESYVYWARGDTVKRPIDNRNPDLISNEEILEFNVYFDSEMLYSPSSFERFLIRLEWYPTVYLMNRYYLYTADNPEKCIDSLIIRKAQILDDPTIKSIFISHDACLRFDIAVPDEGKIQNGYILQRYVSISSKDTAIIDTARFSIGVERRIPKKYSIRNKIVHKKLVEIETEYNLPPRIKSSLLEIREKLHRHEQMHGPDQTCIEMQIVINGLISEINSLQEYDIQLPQVSGDCLKRGSWQENFIQKSLHACLKALATIEEDDSRELWTFHFKYFVRQTLDILRTNEELVLPDSTFQILTKLGKIHYQSGDNKPSREKTQAQIKEIMECMEKRE